MVASQLWRFLMSRHGSSRSSPTWRLISSRHDPPIFSGVGVHLLKFTSAIPFRHMTSGVTVETVRNNSWRVVTTRQAATIRREVSPLLRPVTDRVYSHKCKDRGTLLMSRNLYVFFLVLVFQGCIHYYCNNSGMDFHYSTRIPKGAGCLGMQNKWWNWMA